jgi:hypothetical protein
MKKVCLSLILCFAFVLQFCTGPKKASTKAPSITYVGNIQPIVVNSCSPCHIPPQGNKKPYNTYASVKADIDEIINRIQRNPGEKGFMPQRHPKLSDSTINLFVQWKNTSMLEK